MSRLLAALLATLGILIAPTVRAAPAADAPPRSLAIAVRGTPATAARVTAALPAAIAAVEARLGPIDWSGTEVVATTAAATLGASAPEWAAAYAVPGRGRVVLRMDRIGPYPHSSLGQVLSHEMTHIGLARRAPGRDWPRWFDEGLSMSIARETSVSDAYHLSLAFILGGEVDLDRVDALFDGGQSDVQSGYAVSRAFVAWVEDSAGPDASRRVVDGVAAGQDFERAFAAGAGATPQSLFDSWRQQAVIFYRWVPIVTSTVTLWVGITLLVLLAGARKRRRVKAMRARWAMEDGELTEEDTSGPYGPH